MKTFILLILVGISACSYSQSNSDIEFFRIKNSEKKVHYDVEKPTNEYKAAVHLLFLGYKEFVSSQDASSCTFYPSCSVYAVQIMNKKGIFIGAIDFFDRFCRCNGLSPEKYEVHEPSKLLYDPVD